MSSYLLSLLTRVSIFVPILVGAMLCTSRAESHIGLPTDFPERMVREERGVRLTLPNGQQVVGEIENIHRAGQGKTGATLARGLWHYQGSVPDAGDFAADRDGSIIAIVSDPAAPACNPRPGSADDTLHVVNTALLSSAEVPVTVSFRPASPAH